MLAFAHHRWTVNGKDDVLLPTGVVAQAYKPTQTAPVVAAAVGGEEEEEMKEGGFSTAQV